VNTLKPEDSCKLSPRVLAHYLTDYRTAIGMLNDHKREVFPPDASVHVNSRRYTGPGVVTKYGTTSPDHLCVALPTENIHCYPLEDVTPVDAPAPQPKRPEWNPRWGDCFRCAAQDANGKWHLFETIACTEGLIFCFGCTKMPMPPHLAPVYSGDWRQSLIERPQP
jgi:hypothetical protein